MNSLYIKMYHSKLLYQNFYIHSKSFIPFGEIFRSETYPRLSKKSLPQTTSYEFAWSPHRLLNAHLFPFPFPPIFSPYLLFFTHIFSPFLSLFRQTVHFCLSGASDPPALSSHKERKWVNELQWETYSQPEIYISISPSSSKYAICFIYSYK